MGKITGFLEIDKDDRDYLPIADRLKTYSEFVLPLGDKGTKAQAARCMDCGCLLYTSPSPRDGLLSRMPSSA